MYVVDVVGYGSNLFGGKSVPDQPVDHHEVAIARQADAEMFQRAADLLMRYQFYPSDVMSHVSHFSLQDRWAQPGDRIAQRIHVWWRNGRSLLDMIGMSEIYDVVADERRAGLTYVSTAPHAEQGEWSVRVTWADNDDIVLAIRAISRPNPQEPKRNHRFMRALQKRAYKRGISHFRQLVIA